MKNSRIIVTGDFKADDTVNFKVSEITFTGDGALDYTEKIIESGTTTEVLFNDDTDTDLTEDFFSNKYGKEGFDFYCAIN